MVAAAIDVLDPVHPRRVLLVASNPTAFDRTRRAIGFWRSELTDPCCESCPSAKLIVEALGQ